MMAHTYHPNYTRGINRRINIQAGLEKNLRPYLKDNKAEKAIGLAHMVEQLRSKW